MRRGPIARKLGKTLKGIYQLWNFLTKKQNSAIPLPIPFFCSVILFRSSASAMGGAHALKRVPRIKFPNRHPKSSGSAPETQPLSSSTDANLPFFSSSKASMSVGGKASDQPKRTPVSNEEIEAILLGGCF